MDAKKLLDLLIGAAAPQRQPAQAAPGQAGAAEQGTGGSLHGPAGRDGAVRQVTGHGADELLRKARDVVEQNPGLAQAAAIGLAGLLFGSRRSGRGLPGKLARLGALAVIGGLAYKAFQRSRAGQALLAAAQGAAATGGTDAGTEAARRAPAAGPSRSAREGATGALDVPEGSHFHPVSQTEDDALLYLRTMVAAAACDGHVADAERRLIVRGLVEAGIDPTTTRWLERELESPADVEELAARVASPEKAAQVYAAARLAIDPDTIQEREFLRRLSESLDLEEDVRAQIDATAAALKATES